MVAIFDQSKKSDPWKTSSTAKSDRRTDTGTGTGGGLFGLAWVEHSLAVEENSEGPHSTTLSTPLTQEGAQEGMRQASVSKEAAKLHGLEHANPALNQSVGADMTPGGFGSSSDSEED